MAKNQDYAQQLGSAWALHRKGQNDEAVREFEGLLQLSANNMDALYGLGLAQRSSGHVEAARESFAKCLHEVDVARQTEPHEDRYLMLQKMAKQRLEELPES